MFLLLWKITLIKGLVDDNVHVWVLTVADCFSTNRKRVSWTQVNNYLFATREYFRAFGLILFLPIIQVYSLLLPRYMLQPIRIRFTALSCFETNIYQNVFLQGRTHANKTVTDRQTKFVNKHLITSCSLSSPYISPEIPTNSAGPVTKTHNVWV